MKFQCLPGTLTCKIIPEISLNTNNKKQFFVSFFHLSLDWFTGKSTGNKTYLVGKAMVSGVDFPLKPIDFDNLMTHPAGRPFSRPLCKPRCRATGMLRGQCSAHWFGPTQLAGSSGRGALSLRRDAPGVLWWLEREKWQNWWFGTWLLYFYDFPIRLGMSWSQLTNSYFSEGFKPPIRQWHTMTNRLDRETWWRMVMNTMNKLTVAYFQTKPYIWMIWWSIYSQEHIFKNRGGYRTC